MSAGLEPEAGAQEAQTVGQPHHEHLLRVPLGGGPAQPAARVRANRGDGGFTPDPVELDVDYHPLWCALRWVAPEL